MKTLSSYTEQATTNAINKAGAFFAFSTEQFNEKKKEGVKYCEARHGMICPVGTVKELLLTICDIGDEGIKLDIKENGITNIIKRELVNYECYYVGDPSEAIEVLKDL